MKFTVSSAELLKALTTVNGAVPSKSTLPILACILFERSGDQLRLSATDLEISIVEHLDVQFETNGSMGNPRVAVPAKRLLDTLRALPDLPIQFAADNEFHVVLKTDQGTYKMVGHDGADYPALPELDDAQRIEIEGGLLKRAIQKTGFAVSKDALRPAMMGVYFQIGPDEGRTVATDGHRLVKLIMQEMRAIDPVQFIVPEKAMNLAGRIATDGDCSIATDGSYVRFQFGDALVLARLIDETYPNYEAVIPKDNNQQLSINRAALLAAVKRVGLYSSSMTNQIRLELESNQVKIAAEDIERASEAHEMVLCEYDGEPMKIGFNATYLTEVLSNVDADDVVFSFSSPNRAGILTPQDQGEGESLLMLIMPVMLNTYA